ncbi:MAG: hypothetical protein COV66_01810 [Nitrospinae bacterium CG11_big_fil_rev_8_21_14_0_20_45_15]|nr:MAG: hypothetical protein COV66_01810 [Nitrospinae bacterium CG11_big_fil_rev_8_21_14_0_20_45_15]
MELNYSLLARKPFISWDELVLLLFGCEFGLFDQYGLYHAKDLRIVGVQYDFKIWFDEAIEARQLLGVNSGTLRTDYFIGKKEDVFLWVRDNRVIDWLRENDIEVPNESQRLMNNTLLQHSTTKVEPSPSSSEQGGMDTKVKDESGNFFPVPNGTTWEDIKITLLARDTVNITVKDQSQKFAFHELRMSDKRNGDKPKIEWWVLVLFLKEKGFISKDTEHRMKDLPDKIKPLKKTMKKVFGINAPMIGHYKAEGGYRVNFKTDDKTEISYRQLLALPTTSE